MSTFTEFNPPEEDSKIRGLIERAQSGDFEAREDLFSSFLPLAKKYAEKYENYGVPAEDLYQEACYGLLIAIDRYDVNKDVRFATYAIRTICTYIKRNALFLQNSTIPSSYNEHFYYDIKKYIAEAEQFKEEFGVNPTDQDMSARLNKSLFRIRRIRSAADTFMCRSLDFDENLMDNHSQDVTLRPVENSVLRKEHYIDISGLKMRLTPREMEVLERRCGFTESGEPESWDYISAAMGLGIRTVQIAYKTAIAKFQRVLNLMEGE